MSRRQLRHGARRRRRGERARKAWAALLAFVVGLPLMAGLAAPAAASPAQYLMVDKTVDATEVLLPGNPFSYTIRVNCAGETGRAAGRGGGEAGEAGRAREIE